MKKIFTLFVIALTLSLNSCSSDNNENESSEQPNPATAQNRLRVTWTDNLVKTFKIDWSNNTTSGTINANAAQTNMSNSNGYTAFIDMATGNYITRVEVQTSLISKELKVSLNGKEIKQMLAEAKRYEITFIQNNGVWQPNIITLLN